MYHCFIFTNIIINACICTLHFSYTDEEVVKFLTKCSILDPRFKSLPWLSGDDKDDMYELVISSIVTASHSQSSKRKQSEPAPSQPSGRLSDTEVPATVNE